MAVTPRGQQPGFLRRSQNRPALRRRSSLAVFAQLMLVTSGLAVGGAAAYFGHGYVRSNGTFLLRHLNLEGIPSELRDTVQARLRPALGASLLAIDLDDLRHRLERVPQIRTARLRRVLPDGLEVLVEPRLAWGVLHARDGSRRVARNGLVLGRVRPDDEGLPELSIDDDLFQRVDASGHLPTDIPATTNFHEAVAVVEWLRKGRGQAFGRVESVRVDAGGVVLVVPGRQWEIALGNGRDLDAKERNLIALIQQEMPVGPRLIDLRYRDMVVVGELDDAVADLER